MAEIYLPDPPRDPIHPDQECCLGLFEKLPKTLAEISREIHARPVLILRLRERWKRN